MKAARDGAAGRFVRDRAEREGERGFRCVFAALGWCAVKGVGFERGCAARARSE